MGAFGGAGLGDFVAMEFILAIPKAKRALARPWPWRLRPPPQSKSSARACTVYDFRMTFHRPTLCWPILRPVLSALQKGACRLGLASLLVLAHLSPVQAQEGPQLGLPRVSLSQGMHLITAQVAQTPLQRQIGLMNRKDMPQHEGMLFIFEEPSEQCFWMKNTLLPLTAAFIADDGTIVNLVDMKPQTLDSHCSAKPVRFVLEMNQGWFAKKGMQAGTRLAGAPFEAKR